MTTADFEVELDVLDYEAGKRILFYCDIGGRRELGYIPPSAPEYTIAEQTIAEFRAIKHKPVRLAGPVPCRMLLDEKRARQFITEGGTWGLFARAKKP